MSLAVGDLNHDGTKDLITAATDGNPHVKIYNGKAFINQTFDDSEPDASLIAHAFV